MAGLGALLAPRPILAAPRRYPGGSALGGNDELRELLASSRSSLSTRAVSRSTCPCNRSFCADNANKTSTTASRPSS
jgi:hypothetical protein